VAIDRRHGDADDLRLLAYLGETHREIELLRETVPAIAGLGVTSFIVFIARLRRLPLFIEESRSQHGFLQRRRRIVGNLAADLSTAQSPRWGNSR